MSKLPDRVDMAWIAGDLGLPVATVHQYNKRARRHRREGNPKPGDLPPPDAPLGRTPGWRLATYQAWKANRPGRGAGGGRPRKGD